MHALRQARESLTAVRQRFGQRIRPLSDPEQEAPAPDEEFAPTPIYIGQRTRIVLMAAMVIGLVLLVREAPSIPRLSPSSCPSRSVCSARSCPGSWRS